MYSEKISAYFALALALTACDPPGVDEATGSSGASDTEDSTGASATGEPETAVVDELPRSSPDEPTYACACEDGNTGALGCCGGDDQRPCVANVPTSSCPSACLWPAVWDAQTAKCQQFGECVGSKQLGRDDGLCFSQGPCGAPGQRVCGSGPGCDPGGAFDVMTAKCELHGDADPPCATPANVGGQGPFELLVATDLHAGALDISAIRHHASEINRTHSAWLGRPKSIAAGDPRYADGTLIGDPALVVTTGDLTNFGHGKELGILRSFYEPESQSVLPDTVRLPVYPGLGNHDLVVEGSDDSYARRMLNYVENRMRWSSYSQAWCQAATAFDTSSRSYAWRMGDYHLVQLHDAARGATSVKGSSLAWLKGYLASAVGSSGRPVVLFQHYGVDIFSTQQRWWTAADRAALRDALAGYNVRAIFTGHSHYPGRYQWEGIDVYQGSEGGEPECKAGDPGCTNPAPTGGVIAVRLSSTKVDAQYLDWSDLNGSLKAVGAFAPVHHVHSGRQLVGDDVDLCVDLPGSTQTEGAELIAWGCHGGDNQRFNLVEQDTNVFVIGLEVNGPGGENRCLDIPGWSGADGARVVQWGCNSGTTQRFKLEEQTGKPGRYRLVADHSGKCLTLSPTLGGPITQQPCGQAHQLFKLVP